MSYTSTMRKEPDYLHVEAAGVRTRDTVLALARDCAGACKEHGYHRLLVDVRKLTGRLPMIEVYDLATKDFPKIRQNLALTLVIIDRDGNRDRAQFLEDVAVNQGLHVRVFTDTEKALGWLLEPNSTRTA